MISKKANKIDANAEFERQFALLVDAFGRQDFSTAEKGTRKLLKKYPKNAYCTKLLGSVLVAQKRQTEAIPLLIQSLEKIPDDTETIINLGIAYLEIGEDEAAEKSFLSAIGKDAKNIETRLLVARFYRSKNNLGLAAEHLQRILTISPENLGALKELALISKSAEAHAAAVQLFEKVIAANSLDSGSWQGYAESLHRLNRETESAAAYKKAYELNNDTSALMQKIFADLRAANWKTLESDIKNLKINIRETPKPGAFELLAVPEITQEEIFQSTKILANQYTSRANPSAFKKIKKQKKQKIRIGYVSSDFHQHATSILLVGVIEKHNRDSFEVYGYSYGEQDNSVIGSRIRDAFDEFFDVSAFDFKQTAQKISDDDIDILIDLKGWTNGSRTPLLAWRPAPIQVNWLGYPGTIGSEVLADYIIGDSVVTPRTDESQYAEKLALMPNCYQPNDNNRYRPKPISRAEAGLPEDVFIYCSFNQAYKLNPYVAETWSKILSQTDNSALWLLDPGSEVRPKILDFFSEHGISSERIIFAPKVAANAHLDRLALADLALDTTPYGSHTTCSDALWSGVPMLTMKGSTFASRVSASLLTAVGLSDLITSDAESFVKMGVELYQHPKSLALIRENLIANINTTSLFDTQRFTQDLENLYQAMWSNYENGRTSLIDLSITAPQTAIHIENTTHSFEISNLIKESEAMYHAKEMDGALKKAHQALALDSNNAQAMKIAGVCLIELDQTSEAREYLLSASLKLKDDPKVFYNLAVLEMRCGNSAKSLGYFDQAYTLNPSEANFVIGFSRTLRSLAKYDEALAVVDKALSKNENSTDLVIEKALLHGFKKEYDKALELLSDNKDSKALAFVYRLQSGDFYKENKWNAYRDARAKSYEVSKSTEDLLALHHANLLCGNWSDSESQYALLMERIQERPFPHLRPFDLLALSGIDKKALALAFETHARARLPELPFKLIDDCIAALPVAGEIINIGYISGDFRNHAVGMVLTGIIERHDRNKFKIFGYSSRESDSTLNALRVRSAFDTFRDVENMNNNQLAEQIRADNIHVLVDLSGWTSHSRSEVMAFRPAPVHANWLGIAGGVGVSGVADYMIADAVVTPLEDAPYYSEALALLPHSYQPTDDQRLTLPPMSREDAGLPQDMFVFCSFNQLFKISSKVGKVWAKILNLAPKSVLWLIDYGETARENLRKEFSLLGVSPERIIFAPFLHWRSHSARLQLADLVLDPFPYGGHSSGSDALFMGVPMITMPGDTFASRTGESILRAAGLPELVVRSEDDYVNLAYQLYCDRDRLVSIKNYLTHEGRLQPLFDTGRFTRDLERLYCTMIENRRSGNSNAIKLLPSNTSPEWSVAEQLRQIERWLENGLNENAGCLAERFLATHKVDIQTTKLCAQALHAAGEYSKAIPYLRNIIEVIPDDLPALEALAMALWSEGSHAESRQYIERAVALAPENQALQFGNEQFSGTTTDATRMRINLARMLRINGDLGGAAAQIQPILQKNPKSNIALKELAQISLAADADQAARDLFERVVKVDEEDAEAWFGLGAALSSLQLHSDAARAFRRAYELEGNAEALLKCIHANLYVADWSDLASDAKTLLEGIASSDPVPHMYAFALLSVPGISNKAILRATTAFVSHNYEKTKTFPERSHFPLEGRKIRLGYLSSDFHAHATTALLAKVIEQHNRNQVEVFGYSHGPDDSSDMRHRISSAFDKFKDVSDLSVFETAKLIYDDKIDVLVDLKGWTFASRSAVLAYRPAPIQVNWLGFPGTLGGLADFIIGDKWVTPLENADAYHERLAIMPYCYQPNDPDRVLPAPVERKEFGLPDSAFVFCSLNQSYKINPEVADIWARILRRTQSSVLWLLDYGKEYSANITREFADRGIAENRLIFAPRVGKSIHLSRLALADVALDTFPYGSHTTGSDALWAGVPLISLPGETFASRVGASLLEAVGLKDLIAEDLDDYVRLGIELYNNREKCVAIRNHLREARDSSHLFDASAFTRDLESLFVAMCNTHGRSDRSPLFSGN